MEDILNWRGPPRALAELRKADPEPLSAAAFRKAVGYSKQKALQLRDDLLAWGLVTVEEGMVAKNVPFVKIRLTPAGRRVADLFLAADAEAQKARQEAARQQKDSAKGPGT